MHHILIYIFVLLIETLERHLDRTQFQIDQASCQSHYSKYCRNISAVVLTMPQFPGKIRAKIGDLRKFPQVKMERSNNDNVFTRNKVMTSTEFIKTYSSSMFKLKKLIANNEINARKYNGRYIIDAESASNWYRNLFGEDQAA